MLDSRSDYRAFQRQAEEFYILVWQADPLSFLDFIAMVEDVLEDPTVIEKFVNF